MTHCPAHHRSIGNAQLSIPVQSLQRCRNQVVIRKRGTGADECIASHHAHLQTCILCNHAVFHDGGHEQCCAERQECPIAHHGKHQLHILRNINVVSNDAVLNDRARIDHDIIADGCWAMNDGTRINHAVLADLHQFRDFSSCRPS